ncbi:hypothetical protein Tco_0660216 [Tanacetum coccineum]
MINFIDVSCEDSFGEVLRLKKSNHFSSGSTTPLSDSRPSLISFETSDSLLEEFADELALLDPFPPGNEDVDFEADLREIELLLNRDPSTDFLPKITIDPNPERFTDEPALACLPPPGDDESFLKEDVQEENFQVYSNPLFEFDDNYNSSDINPLFNEILEDVESKDSNVSNFDEPVLLNTPLFDEDECFDPGGDIDEIDVFLAIDVPSDIMDAYNDSKRDVLEILHNTTHNLFPEVFFDHDPRSLKDEPDNDDLMTKDKVFDPGIWEKFLSPSIVRLSSKDRHFLSFTIVIQILLTYPVNFLLSSGNEDTIFNSGIFAFHSSSLEPVAFESHSVHNYSGQHDEERTDTLRLRTSGGQSGRVLVDTTTEVTFTRVSHLGGVLFMCPTGLSTEDVAWILQNGAVNLWSTWHLRLLKKSPMRSTTPLPLSELGSLWPGEPWLRLTFFKDSNNFKLALMSWPERMPDMRIRKFKNDHDDCPNRIRLLEDRNNELSQVNNEQSLRIKELEDLLANKDSALLLPTVVKHLFQSHEYKRSLSEPFNLAIQAGWGKGLTEERSEEDLVELMGRMEGFDAYADTKMKVEYDKLFEKRYPYVEKISRGFRRSIFDLLKVYPDSPSSVQDPPSKHPFGKAPLTSAPHQP